MTLEAEHLYKSFGAKQVLADVSFRAEGGKALGLLGRNGAGKTTLFNCLTDEVTPDGGSALILDEGGGRPLAPEQVGYVFSTPVLPDFLTGYEFLRFYMDVNRDKVSPDRTIDDYFDLVNINKEDRHRLIKGYSHGMKNKVQMLLFIVARPPVILLDEPLTSFDVVVALEIKQLLRELRQDHVIIFSTHILQLATDLCDEIAVLSDGRLRQVDSQTLKSGDFEAEIIGMLKDEEHHD